MAGAPHQKKKLFLLYKLMMEQTDEKHPMTVSRMIAELERRGIGSERKSIYGDLHVLAQCGVDIRRAASRPGGFYIGGRDFGPTQVRMLMDAVRAARFIPPGYSRELVDRLGRLTSRPQREALRSEIFVDYPAKHAGEDMPSVMEIIRSAIEDGCALSFCYPRNPEHHDAPIHTVTPSALAWVDGTYYLLGRRAPHDPLSHFRVDRMTGVQAVAPSGRPRGQVPDAAPLSEAEAYVRTRCSMISGREERVRIRFHASLREAVFERFGRDVELDEQDGNIVVTCSMIPGSGLMGWLFMLGEEAEILQPISLRKDMMRRLAVHNRMYGL